MEGVVGIRRSGGDEGVEWKVTKVCRKGSEESLKLEAYINIIILHFITILNSIFRENIY